MLASNSERIGFFAVLGFGLLSSSILTAADADITARLDSTDGGSAFVVEDAATNQIFKIDSQGMMQVTGPLSSAGGFVGDGAGLTNLIEADPLWAPSVTPFFRPPPSGGRLTAGAIMLPPDT